MSRRTTSAARAALSGESAARAVEDLAAWPLIGVEAHDAFQNGIDLGGGSELERSFKAALPR